jgi:hypothetical protein
MLADDLAERDKLSLDRVLRTAAADHRILLKRGRR